MRKAKDIFRYFILILIAIIFIIPLVWVIYNSFKSNSELFQNPWAWPEIIHFENYKNALEKAHIIQFFKNSVLICVVSLLLCLLFSTTAAFALTRLKWKLSGKIMNVFLLGMMLPIHITMIPLFIILSKVGLVNTYWSLIIIYSVQGLPMAIFILTGFLKSFPEEIEEAAIIDGDTMAGIFLHITLPIVKPSIMTVAIYTFVSMWNELNYALVFLNSQNKMTLPVGLTYFKGQYATDYVSMFAAITIISVPTILVYFIFNKQIIGGIMAGSVKG